MCKPRDLFFGKRNSEHNNDANLIAVKSENVVGGCVDALFQAQIHLIPVLERSQSCSETFLKHYFPAIVSGGYIC